MMVDVAPDTVAVRITVSPTLGLLFDAVIVTAGGCVGSTVTEVDTRSLKPLTSVAVALTTYVPASS